jgi:hypothetical protein
LDAATARIRTTLIWHGAEPAAQRQGRGAVGVLPRPGSALPKSGRTVVAQVEWSHAATPGWGRTTKGSRAMPSLVTRSKGSGWCRCAGGAGAAVRRGGRGGRRRATSAGRRARAPRREQRRPEGRREDVATGERERGGGGGCWGREPSQEGGMSLPRRRFPQQWRLDLGREMAVVGVGRKEHYTKIVHFLWFFNFLQLL